MTITYGADTLHIPTNLRWWLGRDSDDPRPFLLVMGLVDDAHPVNEPEYLDVPPTRRLIEGRCEAYAKRERDRAAKDAARRAARKVA